MSVVRGALLAVCFWLCLRGGGAVRHGGVAVDFEGECGVVAVQHVCGGVGADLHLRSVPAAVRWVALVHAAHEPPDIDAVRDASAGADYTGIREAAFGTDARVLLAVDLSAGRVPQASCDPTVVPRRASTHSVAAFNPAWAPRLALQCIACTHSPLQLVHVRQRAARPADAAPVCPPPVAWDGAWWRAARTPRSMAAALPESDLADGITIDLNTTCVASAPTRTLRVAGCVDGAPPADSLCIHWSSARLETLLTVSFTCVPSPGVGAGSAASGRRAGVLSSVGSLSATFMLDAPCRCDVGDGGAEFLDCPDIDRAVAGRLAVAGARVPGAVAFDVALVPSAGVVHIDARGEDTEAALDVSDPIGIMVHFCGDQLVGGLTQSGMTANLRNMLAFSAPDAPALHAVLQSTAFTSTAVTAAPLEHRAALQYPSLAAAVAQYQNSDADVADADGDNATLRLELLPPSIRIFITVDPSSSGAFTSGLVPSVMYVNGENASAVLLDVPGRGVYEAFEIVRVANSQRCPACGPHGTCRAAVCECDAGWEGRACAAVSSRAAMLAATAMAVTLGSMCACLLEASLAPLLGAITTLQVLYAASRMPCAQHAAADATHLLRFTHFPIPLPLTSNTDGNSFAGLLCLWAFVLLGHAAAVGIAYASTPRSVRSLHTAAGRVWFPNLSIAASKVFTIPCVYRVVSGGAMDAVQVIGAVWVCVATITLAAAVVRDGAARDPAHVELVDVNLGSTVDAAQTPLASHVRRVLYLYHPLADGVGLPAALRRFALGTLPRGMWSSTHVPDRTYLQRHGVWLAHTTPAAVRWYPRYAWARLLVLPALAADHARLCAPRLAAIVFIEALTAAIIVVAAPFLSPTANAGAAATALCVAVVLLLSALWGRALEAAYMALLCVCVVYFACLVVGHAVARIMDNSLAHILDPVRGDGAADWAFGDANATGMGKSVTFDAGDADSGTPYAAQQKGRWGSLVVAERVRELEAFTWDASSADAVGRRDMFAAAEASQPVLQNPHSIQSKMSDTPAPPIVAGWVVVSAAGAPTSRAALRRCGQLRWVEVWGSSLLVYPAPRAKRTGHMSPPAGGVPPELLLPIHHGRLLTVDEVAGEFVFAFASGEAACREGAAKDLFRRTAPPGRDAVGARGESVLQVVLREGECERSRDTWRKRILAGAAGVTGIAAWGGTVARVARADHRAGAAWEEFGASMVTATSTYRLCTSKSDPAVGVCWLRQVRKATLTRAQQAVLATELAILSRLQSRFLVAVSTVFETGRCIGWVFPHAPGGSVLHHLQAMGAFPEDDAAFYAGEALLGLEALHANGLLFRNLAPLDCLFDAEGHLVLANPGIPVVPLADAKVAYGAPEVLRGEACTAASDLFSLGCVLSLMLHAAPPFRGTSRRGVVRAVCEDAPRLADSLTPAGRDVLGALLVKDPSKRLSTAERVKAHVWFTQQGVSFPELARGELVTPLLYQPPTPPRRPVDIGGRVSPPVNPIRSMFGDDAEVQAQQQQSQPQQHEAHDAQAAVVDADSLMLPRSVLETYDAFAAFPQDAADGIHRRPSVTFEHISPDATATGDASVAPPAKLRPPDTDTYAAVSRLHHINNTSQFGAGGP